MKRDNGPINAIDLAFVRAMKCGRSIQPDKAIELAKLLIAIGHRARAKFWLCLVRQDDYALFMLAKLYAESRSMRASVLCRRCLDGLKARRAQFDPTTIKEIADLRLKLSKRNFDPYAHRDKQTYSP